MRVGLVGPSYNLRSLPIDAQRTINLFPIVDETGKGKEIVALYGTPGLVEFCSAGSGEIRAEFASSNGRAFVVSFNELYEIASNGSATYRGSINSNSGNCIVVENPTQMAICDGEDLYIYTYSTNALEQVIDADFPGCSSLDYIDGYFVVSRPDTGEFYISDLNNGLAWNALDFATAEGSPDNLVRVFAALNNLWLFGETTTEVWYNSGDADFPFSRQEGAKIEMGCAALHSVCKLDNSIFWLGKDKDGQGIVYRITGFIPQRISTFAIEERINGIADLSSIRAYTYQEDGHTFYVLTSGGLETTLVYDVSTQQWHERAYLETDGTYSTHLATTHMFAFGKHLVGDKQSGTIYEMSLDYYSDAGRETRRERVFAHITDENKGFKVKELQVDFEYGVGLSSGQGQNPLVWLQVSEDGARTWSPEYEASIGAIGAYKTRAVWRRLGHTENIMTFRVAISDPVKVAICGAYIK